MRFGYTFAFCAAVSTGAADRWPLETSLPSGLSVFTMDSMDNILRRLAEFPGLLGQLSFTQIFHFIIYSSRIKNDIILTQPASHTPFIPPEYLSPAVQGFLAEVLQVNVHTVQQCWAAFKDLAWNEEYITQLDGNSEEVFQCYGIFRGLGA